MLDTELWQDPKLKGQKGHVLLSQTSGSKAGLQSFLSLKPRKQPDFVEDSMCQQSIKYKALVCECPDSTLTTFDIGVSCQKLLQALLEEGEL